MKYISVILITMINTMLAGGLLAGIIRDNNDKSGIVLIFGYTLIVTGNVLLWGITSLLNKRFAKTMGEVVLVLVLFLLPVLIFAFQY